MSLKHTVKIIQFEDWQLWYVDNKLEFSDHSMDEDEAFALGVKLGDCYLSYAYVDHIFTKDYERVYEVFGDGRHGTPDNLDEALLRMTPEEVERFINEIGQYTTLLERGRI